MIVATGPQITLDDLPPQIARPREEGFPASANEVLLTVGTTVEEAKRRLILKTLEATGYDKVRAARILGITARTIYDKLGVGR